MMPSSPGQKRLLSTPVVIATLSLIALMVILGAPASTSVSQQSQAPIELDIFLYFDATNNQSIPYRLLPLLKIHGILVVNPVVTGIAATPPGVIRVVPDPNNPGDLLLIPSPPGGFAQVTIQAQDAKTGAPVTIQLNIQVVGVPNVPPPPQPQQAGLVPFPAALTLCVGETRSIYIEAQVNAGGLLHRGPADIVWLDAPGAAGVIDLQPPPMGSFPGGTPLPPPVAYGWIQVTGLAAGGPVTITVWGQLQPLGMSPFTDVVWTTFNITVTPCPPPPTINAPCPQGLRPVGGQAPLRIPNLPPNPPQTTRFPPPPFAMPVPPVPGLNFVGLERFEVGVTPGSGMAVVPQWPFPTGQPGVINLGRGERRELVGDRTNFFVWGPAFLDPNPPRPSPDRRFATRWVAYRGYFNCAAPVVKFRMVFNLPPPGVLQLVDEPLPKEIKDELAKMGLDLPDEVPEDQRRPENRIFELIRQEPNEPRLGVGLNPWTGRIEGAICSTDVVFFIVKVCSATPPGVYKKLYDVFKGTGPSRERIAQLWLEIELKEGPTPPGQPPGGQPLPGTGIFIVTVRAKKTTGQPLQIEINWRVQRQDGALLGQGTMPTPFQIQRIPDKAIVELTAPPSAGALRFKHWETPAGNTPSNPLRRTISSNETITAVYEETIPTGEKVTLVVRAWRYTSSGYTGIIEPISVSIQGNPTFCSGNTPYACQVNKNTQVTLQAPPAIPIGGVPHGFVQWWVCPGNYANPPNQAACDSQVPPNPTVSVRMDASKTMAVVYAPPGPPLPPPP